MKRKTQNSTKKQGRYLTINEFSRLSRASARSLRYYDKIGIFSPAYVDPETGYRYYSINQIYKLNLVRCCVEEGIPVDEIRSYTADTDMLEAQKFFERCLELSQEQYRRARATMLRMEAYNTEYTDQMTDDMVTPDRREDLGPMLLLVTPFGKADPTSYREYLKRVTFCLQRATELELIPLAHQGVIRLEDGRWCAFVNLYMEMETGSSFDGGPELRLLYFPRAAFEVTSVMGEDIERCFSEAFTREPERIPKMIMEAWAYPTVLDIPVLNIYYEFPSPA